MQPKSSTLLHLSSQIDIFCKSAGLLKVPQEVLAKASDFIISCYSSIMFSRLSDLFTAYSFRKISYDEIQSQIRNIEAGLYYIKRNEDDAFINWAERKDNKIYYFNEGEDSVKTGLVGMFSKNKTNPLFFTMYEDKPDSFNIELRINYDDINVNIIEYDLTFKECRDIFRKHLSSIEYVLESFKHFYDNFEMFHELKEKALQMCYGICSRNIKDFGNGSNKDFIVMRIPVADMPYINDAKINSIFLGIRFTTSENTSNIYSKEQWSGLWSEHMSDPSHQTPYIGTVYVAPNIERDWDNMLRFGDKELLKSISAMKGTVRHEIQHFMQSFMNFAKNIQFAGKPSGSGKSINKQKNTSSDRPAHELRDVEFYTRLSDAIDQFNQFKTNIPVGLHKSYAKYFIDAINSFEFARDAENFEYNIVNNEYENKKLLRYYANNLIFSTKGSYGHVFFKALKENASSRYQKATKEFYKAVNV